MTSLSPLLALLRSRCDAIDRRWRACDYSVLAFSSIVDDSTSDLDLMPFGRLENLLPLLEQSELAKLQQLSSFSDLYLKLFDNGRFWVEILNWWGSDINIHDHDFAGVQFQLSGDSLNIGYDFVEDERMDGVVFGKIDVSSATVWRPGNRSIVNPGRMAPHNVCHMSVPTVSLLIRTHPIAQLGPQWNYFPPGVAGSYAVADATFRKRVQGLRLLARGENISFRRAFTEFSSRATQRQLLFALVKMIDIIFKKEHVELLDDLASRGVVDGRTIEAVVFYRAMESIKYLKNSTSFPRDIQLALSIVASGTDRSQFRQIIDLLRAGGFEPGFEDPLAVLRSVRSTSIASHLDSTFSLFEAA